MSQVTVHIVAGTPSDITRSRNALIGIPGVSLVQHKKLDARSILRSGTSSVLIYRTGDERIDDQLAKVVSQCKLILISDKVENAVKAYDLGATDFLMGSYSVERMRKAVCRALSLDPLGDAVRSNGQVRPGAELHLKSGKSFVRVDVHRIELLQGMGNYTKLHMADGHILVNETMVRMMELLPPEHFLRIHRSYIICIHAIRSFGRNTIEWRGREIPIGRSYKQSVLQALTAIERSHEQ